MEAAIAEAPVRQVVKRMVPDPSMTDAEFYYQLAHRSGPKMGKVEADVNLVELIGGLARIKARDRVQEEAAARFRNLHDRAQLGGARAMDYTAARVDTSGPSEDSVWEIGEQARRDYSRAVRRLGMLRSSLVEKVVVHDQSMRQMSGGKSRERARLQKDLLEAIDELAVHFGLTQRKRS